MLLQPLRIEAQLFSPISVLDDWAPSLEAVLEYVWIDDRGLLMANPDPNNLIYPELPLKAGEINGTKYWCCSSPHYRYRIGHSDRKRKRWGGDAEGYPVNWGKGSAKIQTDAGRFKSADLPVFLRSVDTIYWWAVGDLDAVQQMLNTVPSIGKNRGTGYGQVLRWTVLPAEHDYHLWGKSGQLMRPVPANSLPGLERYPVQRWAWTTPFNLPQNKVLCAMPTNNAQQITTDWFTAQFMGE